MDANSSSAVWRSGEPSASASAISWMTAQSETRDDRESKGFTNARSAAVWSMIVLARTWSFQKSGSTAAASSCSSLRRRFSMSKIASHLCQSFAQLAEARNQIVIVGHTFPSGRLGRPRPWPCLVARRHSAERYSN
jgi:hypothetical protein